MLLDLQMWLELGLKGKNIKPFFEKNNIKTIAIYGCGYLGEHFCDEAEKYGVEIKYYIDREAIEFRGFSVLKPSQMNVINGIDLIVICIGRDSFEMVDIYHAINKTVSAITLREILQICFYKEIILPYCESVGVIPYIFSWPVYAQIQNLSPMEKAISSMNASQDVSATNPKYFEDVYSAINEYGNEYIQNVFTQSPVIKKGNTFIHSDINSKYVNIIQGIRFTHGAPETFNKTIHILGQCVALGYGVDDSRTIASCLQKKLASLPDDNGKFRVLNHGVWGMNPQAHTANAKLRSIHCNKGDIVLFVFDWFYNYSPINLFSNTVNEHRNIFFCVLEEFCNLRDGKLLYFDRVHLSHWGMERTAQYMFTVLKNEGAFLKSKDSNIEETDALKPANPVALRKTGSLEDYLSFLKKYKRNNAINGAIVMNCNPFTNGHRYLIETAASSVDLLYVFVVEEDKSEFAFEDRLRLVKLGTDDLKNVKVIPGGKFIISSITFPEYFVKDALKDIIINPSKDVEIFAKHIAPSLNISKRFMGQEPLDPITAQYNQVMKTVLPKYNIEAIEIPRIGIDGDIISASKVRMLLKAGRVQELSKYVPETTLTFLLQK